MAYDGIEVEIKIPTDAGRVAPLLARLREVGGREKRQVDEYFHDPAASFTSSVPIERWLSLRNRGDVILNHKRFVFDDSGRPTYNEETEAVVRSADEARRFLAAIGFVPLIVVDKVRVEAELDGFQVSVDVVRGLGCFVEIEALRAEGTPEETRTALARYARSLGLAPESEDVRTYPYMLIERQLGGHPAP